MADNIVVKDANGVIVTMATKDVGSIQHTKQMNVNSLGEVADFIDPGQAEMNNSLPFALAYEHAPTHDTAAGANPVQIGLEARTTNATAVGDGDQVRSMGDVQGRTIVKPYSPGALDWSYAAAASGISNTTTAVPIKAAGGASNLNCITAIQLSHNVLGGVTELAIRDGAGGTVLWRIQLQTEALAPLTITFPSPLKGTANTLLEAVTLTAVTGNVYVNAQGFVGR